MKWKINEKTGSMSIITDNVTLKACFLKKVCYTYNKEDGSLNASFTIPKDDYFGSELEGVFNSMLMISKEQAEEKIGSGKAKLLTEVLPYEMELDADNDYAETGNLLFKIKNKGRIKTGDDTYTERVIPIVDSRGNPTDVNPVHPSIVRFSMVIKPYYMASQKSYGISKFVTGMQIVDLHEYQGNGTGFDVVEDGYVSEKEEEKQSFDSLDV